MNKPATFCIENDGQTRIFNGIVSRFEQGEVGTHFTRYYARVVPRLWLLNHRRDDRIFQHMNVPEIVQEVLKEAGVPADALELRLRDGDSRVFSVWFAPDPPQGGSGGAGGGGGTGIDPIDEAVERRLHHADRRGQGPLKNGSVSMEVPRDARDAARTDGPEHLLPISDLLVEKVLGSVAGPLAGAMSPVKKMLQEGSDYAHKAQKARDALDDLSDADPSDAIPDDVSMDQNDAMNAPNTFDQMKQDAEDKVQEGKDIANDPLGYLDEQLSEDGGGGGGGGGGAKFPGARRTAKGLGVDDITPSLLQELGEPNPVHDEEPEIPSAQATAAAEAEKGDSRPRSLDGLGRPAHAPCRASG